MKNKGFTLIELMGVIILLALVALISFPSMINVLKDSSGKIDAATEALIIGAAKDKVEKEKNSYPKTDGKVYCVTIQGLIDGGYLISNLKEGTNSDDIDKERKIKITVESEKYNYKLLKSSEECK